MKNLKIIKLFGISFVDENFQKVKQYLDKGGLLVMPAAPALANIDKNAEYHNSLKNADLALFDSGFLCIILKTKGIKVKKFSGYKFLKNFFTSIKKCSKKKKLLLIDPNHEQSSINKNFLLNNKIFNFNQYIAPNYNKNKKIEDKKLLNEINKYQPNYIVVNLGGGTQEILGNYIKKNIKFKLSIICSGAAISFLTKQQAPLTNFLDKIYLGWLIRIIFNPIAFLPRYLYAFRLIYVFNKSKKI